MDLSNRRKQDQHRQTNRLYHQMRFGAAARELADVNGERNTSPGYDLVHNKCGLTDSKNSVLPIGAHLWYKPQDVFWWLGKSPNIRHLQTSSSFVSSTTLGLSRSPSSPRSSTLPSTSSADRGAFQMHRRSSFKRGILRNFDESRGLDTVPA